MRNRLLRLFLCLAWVLGLSCPGIAQRNDYQFARYNTERGLSHNQVNCFLKDSRGFVWIGTASGLNRFDGYRFRVFKHDPADSTSISDGLINGLFEDPLGRIWINTRIGFDIYDPVTERISHDANAAARQFGLKDGGLTRIVKTKSGDYWINHNQLGLLKYISARKTLVNVPLPVADRTSGTSRTVTDFAEDHHGKLYVVFDDGLLVYVDGKVNSVVGQSPLLKNRLRPRSLNYRVFIDTDGGPWVYMIKSVAGAFYFDLKENALREANTSGAAYRLNNNAVSSMISGPDGRIWVGTDHGGINVIDKKQRVVTTLQSSPDDPRTISQNSIQTLYRDPTGVIWAGTFKQGFCNYHKNIFRFTLVRHQPGNTVSLPYDDINVFAEDKKGNLWIGTNGGGLVYYNRENNSFRQYKNEPGNSNSLSNNVIVSMFLDKQNVLWIGTYFGGLNRFDGQNFKRYQHSQTDSTSLADDRIWEIFEDSRDRLWVGTLGDGLDLLDRKSSIFTHHKRLAPNSIASDYVSALLEDRLGNLWVGTANGVDVLIARTGRFVHYAYSASDPGSLSSDAVTALSEDAFGNIWIGTSQGLNRFDAATSTFVKYGSAEGLSDHTIMSAAVDRFDNLWLGTPTGLMHFMVTKRDKGVPTVFRTRTYNEVDGLQGRGFNENAALRLRSGELVFAGAGGFSIFDPAEINDGQASAKVVLTDFQVFNRHIRPGEEVNGKAILDASITATDKIVLNYNQDVFSIEFAALNFLHPEKNHYLYRLEGFNDQWFEADDTRRVTYTNLDPGTYVFRVKIKDGGNTTERMLQIVVNPPLWRTGWAYLLYALAIIGALMVARWILIERERMNFKLEQERRYAQQLHELDMMKIRFFTNVSHEFRTPLTLMLTPLENLLKNIRQDTAGHGQLSLIYRNAQRLLNLVTQLLDFKKLEVEEGHFHPERGDIIQFVRQIAQTFSDLSEHKHIGYRFATTTDSRYTDFDQDKLSKVMYNLLSNAFKFTPENGTVDVRLRILKTDVEQLEIVVSDTGIGIPLEAQDKVFERFYQHPMPDHMLNQGSGIGLSIVAEFVRMHSGTISLKSVEGEGSTFTVVIPLPDQIAPAIPVVEASAPENAEYMADIDFEDSQQARKRPVALLVEDNDEFREYLTEVLKNDYQVLQAANGKIGLEMTLEHVPDLIVSDVMMPEMDGTTLCRSVKTDRRISHIPVILLTARAEEEQQLQGYQTGADAYVTKPFRLDMLRVRMENLIRQRERVRQQFQQHIVVRPSEVSESSLDEQFVSSAIKVVEDNLANAEYTVEELSEAMSMSRMYLYKKLLSLTGKTPIEFIRVIRMRRGADLLQKSQLTVSEIAYQIGFNNPKYFAKLFKEEYGVLPTTFRKQPDAMAPVNVATEPKS